MAVTPSTEEFAPIFASLVRARIAAAGLEVNEEKAAEFDGILTDIGTRLGKLMLDLMASGIAHGIPTQDLACLVTSAIQGYIARTVNELTARLKPEPASPPDEIIPKREDMN